MVLVIKLLIEIGYIFFTIIICLSTRFLFDLYEHGTEPPVSEARTLLTGLGTHSLAPWFEIHPPLDFPTSSHWLTLP